MTFNIIDLKQGTQDWLEWRKSGITASEIAAILGVSPYKTPWAVWAEKTGLVQSEDLSNNPLVAAGVAQEDTARQLFEQAHDDILLPVCVESTEHPFLKASLDGLSQDNVPVELKVPSESTWDKVNADGENSEAFKLYYPQVQHQMLVTGASHGWLVFYRDGQLREFHIEPDPAMQDAIVQAASAFWQSIVEGKEPAKDPERDVYHPNDDERAQWEPAAERWLECSAELKSLEQRVKEVKAEQTKQLGIMKSLMGSFMHAEAAGLKVTRFGVRGTVDYDRLMADKGISPDELETTASRAVKGAKSRRLLFDVDLEPKRRMDAAFFVPG